MPTAVLDRFQAYTHWMNLELDKSLDDSSDGRLAKIFADKKVNVSFDGH